MLTEEDFPTAKQVAARLREIRNYSTQPARDEYDTDGHCDIRLQVYESGEWAVRWGDPSYDQDHRGYWGGSSVAHEDTDAELLDVALDLIDQAQEDCAMQGELEEEAATTTTED